MISTNHSILTQWEGRVHELSDRFNPLAVREVRQAIKAKSFLVVFGILLIGSWGFSFFSILEQADDLEYLEIGPNFFLGYFFVLVGCLMFAIPSSAFFSMAQEFHDRAFEMLAVTTLSPSRIVMGKIQGAVVIMLIYSSAIAPFVCLSYLLGGIGVLEIFSCLLGLFLISLAMTLFAVMMGSLSQKPWLEVMNLIILLFVALIASGFSYSLLATTVLMQGISLWSFMTGLICFAIFLGFVSLISLGIAQAQLTTTFLPIGYRRDPNAPYPHRPEFSHPNAPRDNTLGGQA